jgi:thioredoxin reductase (NADPH)
MNIKEVIIIGGGPAGLAAALYTARANLNPFVIAGSPPGGQLTLTSDVENYPGFESILGPELIQKYRNHVLKFGTRFADENVTKVDFSQSPFTISTGSVESGKSYQAKAVIIATGAKALWLGLENETRLRGKGVSACATCDGFFFRDKIVAVVGGGDTAMEEALTLTKFATKVYVIHRKDSFRASKIMADRVQAHPKIEILWNTVVTDVLGENKVEGIKIAKLLNGQIANNTKNNNLTVQQFNNEELKVDGFFLAIGHKPDTEVFKNHIELDEKGYIITDLVAAWKKNSRLNEGDCKFQSKTSVNGVFAAGDCVDYIYRQAATAVGMGVGAALDTERWLETQ